MLLCDFLSNMAEMFIRNGGHFAASEDITQLAIIALCRAALICCILLGFELYKSLLNKDVYKRQLVSAVNYVPNRRLWDAAPHKKLILRHISF